MNRHYDDWIEGYLAYTENTEPPYLFRLWNAISAVAGALQRKTSVQLQKGRRTYPNMFIALVGDSGSGKSDSMGPAKVIVEGTGVQMSANRYTTESLIRSMKQALVSEPRPDGTSSRHSSLSVHASELINFFGDKDADKLQVLCDLYDCGETWEYKTKDKKLADKIIKPYLNIIGGITPGLMRNSLPAVAIGGGLTSRMICVFGEKLEKVVPISIETQEDRENVGKLIDDLTSIKSLYGAFKVTNKFIEGWEKWYTNARLHYPFRMKQLDSYCSRRTLHILKMTMIVCASESDQMILKHSHLARAIEYLQLTEKVMGRVFEGVGESKLSGLTSEIMRYIATSRETTSSKIHGMFFRDALPMEIDEIVNQLSKMNFCNITTSGKIVYNEKANEN